MAKTIGPKEAQLILNRLERNLLQSIREIINPLPGSRIDTQHKELIIIHLGDGSFPKIMAIKIYKGDVWFEFKSNKDHKLVLGNYATHDLINILEAIS